MEVFMLKHDFFKPPVARNAVFDHLKTGDLWSGKARYIDDWYAVEMVDDQTVIIGEPKSSQYNLSYLIIGKEEAILFDTGSGEHGPGTPSIRQVVQGFTDRPLRVVLSHFHYDHTGGVDAFDGVTMIDLPYLRAKVKRGTYRVSVWEHAGLKRPLLRVNGWVKPDGIIDLGGRTIQCVNTPGHTPEAITLIDHHRKYVFTGDFMYKHLGGILVFVPGSDHDEYIDSVERLAAKTADGYRYFGAHGLPEYDHAWLYEAGEELVKAKACKGGLPMSVSSVAPWIPLKVHGKGQLLIYFTPIYPARLCSLRVLMGLAFLTVCGALVILL